MTYTKRPTLLATAVTAMAILFAGCAPKALSAMVTPENTAPLATPAAVIYTLTPAASPVPTASPELTPELDYEPDDREWEHPPFHPDLIPIIKLGYPLMPGVEMAPAPRFDVPLTPNDQPEFCRDDLVAGDLRPGMTQEEVLSLLGQPSRAYAYMYEDTGTTGLRLYYDCGNRIVLSNSYYGSPFKLSTVCILADLPGPRGLRVGDTLDDVLSAFRVDPGSAGPLPRCDGPILYATEPYIGDQAEGWADAVIPPSGLLDFSGEYGIEGVPPGLLMVEYYFPAVPFTYDDLYSCPFREQSYSLCRFYIQDGLVACYSWGAD